MNKSIFTYSCALFFLIHYSSAQDSLSAKIKEPDFPFEPTIIDSNYNQTSLPVEQHGTGYSRGKFLYIIDSPRSTFVINKSNLIRVVVKQGLINGTMTNVKDIYRLFKMDINKKMKRICAVSTVDGTTVTREIGLPVTYTKVRDDIFLLEFHNLEPGEYTIEVTVREPKLFSFSVN
jgi:hypothetical protein